MSAYADKLVSAPHPFAATIHAGRNVCLLARTRTQTVARGDRFVWINMVPLVMNRMLSERVHML